LKNPIQVSRDHLKNNGMGGQTYLEHAAFAITNSFILIVAGIKGVIHGVFPFLFPFSTSRRVILSFVSLIQSGRHKQELRELVPTDFIYKKHLED